MIRYKSQPSQAKYERYPAISSFLVSLIKALKTANLKENVPAPKTDARIAEVRFVCKLVLRANLSFLRFARNRPSRFTGKSQFFTFCP